MEGRGVKFSCVSLLNVAQRISYNTIHNVDNEELQYRQVIIL